MPSAAHSAPVEQDFVPFATAALDFHRALNLPHSPLVPTRTELDTLHEHLATLVELLDAHTMRALHLLPREAEHLSAARLGVWQAADHLHAAYHTAPHLQTGEIPGREACCAGLPEGAPEVSVCRRHQATGRLMRRRTTPADLHSPFPGLDPS